MKRGTRMLAFLLSALMLTGLFPFSVAADTVKTSGTQEVVIPVGGTAGDVTVDELIEAVGESSIIFNTDFNALSVETVRDPNKIDVFGGVSTPDTVLNLVDKSSAGSTFVVVDDGFGGKAIQFTKEAEAGEMYIDLINQNSSDKNSALKKFGDTKGKGFVFQTDLKYSTGMCGNAQLFGALTRVINTSAANMVIPLIGVTSKGELYPSSQPGNIIGYLNSEVFTTVAVHVVPSINLYYIYINGVNINPDGYVFLSDTQKATIAGTYSVDGTDYTLSDTDFILNAVRMYQGNTGNLSEGDLCIDNLSAYYSETYLGEKEAVNGFGELNGKAYQIYNGSRIAGTTVGGYVYGSDGAVTHYVSRTPAVDLSKALTTGKTLPTNTDGIRDLINASRAAIQNDNILPGHTLWEWTQIKGGAELKFFTLETDLTGYDALEINFYTDGIQQVPTNLIFSNSFVDPSDKKECYWHHNLNFGDKTYTAFKSDGTTSSGNIGKNPISADGWTSYVVELSDFSKNRSSTWTDIETLRFTTSGWDLDYAFAEDGVTRLYNNGTETIFFESINLITYVPVTSVDEVFGDTVDGVRLPKYGYGWATYGSNTFYYAPWTNEIVKDAAVIDLEDGLSYSFDASGRCLGTADGAVRMGDDYYYFVDGVMQKSNITVGEDEYQIGSDGRIDGIIGKNVAGYTPDAPYVNAPHSSDVSYIYYADFNDLEPGIINTKTGIESLVNYNKTGNNYLNAVMKGNDIIVEDRGDGNRAIGYFNYTSNTDPYMNAWVANEQTEGKRIVIDYDLKIGTDWDADGFNLLQVIGGVTRKFYGILQLNKDGYITLGGNYIARLQTDEYTRISSVIDVPAMTIDVYINGVKLVDSYRFTTDANFTRFSEIRFMQYVQNAGQGTIYLDNFYVYEADEPQYVVEGVTLRDGYVTEDDGVTRYYENGIIIPDKMQSTETIADLSDFLNNNSGKVVYTDKNTEAVFDRGGVHAININLPVTNISSYQYIEFDMYMSGKAPVDFLVNVGQRERMYEVVDYDEATQTGYVTGNYTYSSGGTVLGNKTFTSRDGSISVSGSLRLKDGKYYLRTWNYSSFSFAFDSDELWNNIRKDNPEDEGGWVTIRIPVASIGGSAKNEFEVFQISVTGWSLNVNRPWNPEKNANKAYPDANNYTIRYSDIRLVKPSSEAFGLTTPGWNEDKTEYGDPVTMTKVTGVNVIDGLYYNFDSSGKLVGLCDGVYDTLHYVQLDSGSWVRTTAKRLFEDGVMQFGRTEVSDGFYIADEETGALISNTVVEMDGVFYGFNETGLASICNGLVQGMYFESGLKVTGERELDGSWYYFEDGIPTAKEIVKNEDGNRVTYIYGEDGKLVDKVVVVCQDITLTIVMDGTTVSETVSFSTGKTFRYDPRAIEGKTYVITDGDGNVVDSDYILIESVSGSASYTITYTDAE